MNARFRKGKDYGILSGTFKNIRLRYYGFNHTTREYLFKDGTTNTPASIKWNIPANNHLVLSQLESERRKSNG